MRACAILGLLAGGEALTWVAAWHTIARHAILELAIALIPLLLLLLLLLLWHVALLRQVHLLLGELRLHGNVGVLRHELLLRWHEKLLLLRHGWHRWKSHLRISPAGSLV